MVYHGTIGSGKDNDGMLTPGLEASTIDARMRAAQIHQSIQAREIHEQTDIETRTAENSGSDSRQPWAMERTVFAAKVRPIADSAGPINGTDPTRLPAVGVQTSAPPSCRSRARAQQRRH